MPRVYKHCENKISRKIRMTYYHDCTDKKNIASMNTLLHQNNAAIQDLTNLVILAIPGETVLALEKMKLNPQVWKTLSKNEQIYFKSVVRMTEPKNVKNFLSIQDQFQKISLEKVEKMKGKGVVRLDDVVYKCLSATNQKNFVNSYNECFLKISNSELTDVFMEQNPLIHKLIVLQDKFKKRYDEIKKFFPEFDIKNRTYNKQTMTLINNFMDMKLEHTPENETENKTKIDNMLTNIKKSVSNNPRNK